MIDRLKITVLSENTTRSQDFISEHGLALHIEADSHKILFDTGASDNFLKNAEKLNLALTDTATVILSHGHYDHTGGLQYVYGKQIHCHPDLFIPKYKTTDQKEYTYIGNEYIRCFYENNNRITFRLHQTTTELFPGFWLITDFKKEPQKPYFYKRTGPQEYLPDDFSDELALAIQTSKGLVIITGCAHSGIINIIDKGIAITGEKHIHMLLGGFHLSKESSSKVREVANKINDYTIQNIGISHCTGKELSQYLNCKNVFNFNTGETVYA